MINLFNYLFHREASSMVNKKSEPVKVKDIEICDLCGKSIKKGASYFRNGKEYVHDQCHANVLKYGKSSGK